MSAPFLHDYIGAIKKLGRMPTRLQKSSKNKISEDVVTWGVYENVDRCSLENAFKPSK